MVRGLLSAAKLPSVKQHRLEQQSANHEKSVRNIIIFLHMFSEAYARANLLPDTNRTSNLEKEPMTDNQLPFLFALTKDWYMIPQSNKDDMMGRIVLPNSLKAYSTRTGTSG